MCSPSKVGPRAFYISIHVSCHPMTIRAMQTSSINDANAYSSIGKRSQLLSTLVRIVPIPQRSLGNDSGHYTPKNVFLCPQESFEAPQKT